MLGHNDSTLVHASHRCLRISCQTNMFVAVSHVIRQTSHLDSRRGSFFSGLSAILHHVSGTRTSTDSRNSETAGKPCFKESGIW